MKVIKVLAITFLALFLLSSCEESSSVGTMKILLHSDISKTMTVGETVLDITKYSVSGSGPGGKTFALDTTSASVTLEGVILGSWTVKATGLNAKGKEVAYGETSFVLTDQLESQTIVLSTVTGSGSLQLKYEWDLDISDPQIDIVIENRTSPQVRLKKSVKPNPQLQSCTLTVPELASGFYTVSSVLYNEETKILGCVEAIRIANGEKTSGTITLKQSAAYSTELETLNVFRKNNSSLTGHIENAKPKIEAGIKTDISLSLDSSYSTNDGCKITWYLDGQVLQQEEKLPLYGSEITFYPQVGTHIINAVVTCDDSQSIGSATWKFVATSSAKEGSVIYLGSVLPSNDNNLFLEKDTLISPLSSDKILLITPSMGTLRICSVYNNTLTINKKYSSSEDGYSFINNINYAFSDKKMNVFAVVESKNTINFLRYNPTKVRIEQAYRGGDIARYESSYNNSLITANFTDLNKVFLNPTSDYSGNILLFEPTGSYIVSFNSSSSDLSTCQFVLKPNDVSSIKDADIGFKKIVLLADGSDRIFSCNFDNNQRTSDWKSFETNYENPTIIRLLNSENLLLSDNSSISWYSYSKSSGWYFRKTIDTSVKFLETSDDSKFFWVVTEDNSLVSYTTKDNLIHAISSIKFDKNIVQMCVNTNFIILQADDNSLFICQISQGEEE